MQELSGIDRLIAQRLAQRGKPVSPDTINSVRQRLNLKPSTFGTPETPAPEGGGFLDIFKGEAARGLDQAYAIPDFAKEKLTPFIGETAAEMAVSGGPIASQLFSRLRPAARQYLQGVASAPENQPRPGEEDTFKTNLAKASASSVSFIPAGAMGAMFGGPVGAAIAVGAQGAGMEGVSGYYEALEQTGDEEKAWTAFALKGALGATEGLDALVPVAGRLGKVLFAINRGTKGALSTGLAGITAKTLAAGAAQGAATNFLQEVGQEVGSNEVDKYLDLNPQTRLELLDAIKQYSWTVGAPSALLGTFFGGLEAKASQSEAQTQRAQYLESARVEREAQPTERVTVSTTPPGQIDPNAPPAQAEVDLAPEAPTDEVYQKVQSDTGDLTGEVEVPESLKPLAEFAAKRGFNLRAVTTREGSVFRGATMGKDILLNVNRPDDAIEYTFDHELSHGLKAKMGESWDTLRASIAEADPQGLAAWEEAAGDRQQLTEALRTEEGVGYYVENVLAPYLKAQRQSPEALAKIAQDDRTTFRKMVEGVLDIANEFGAGFNTYKAQIKKVLGDTGTVGKRMPPKRAVAIARQFSEAWNGLIDVAKNEAMVEAERVKTEEAAAQAKAEQRAAEIEQEYADVAATGQAAPTQGYSEAAMAQAVGEDLAEYAGKQGYAEIEAAARATPLLLEAGTVTADEQRQATMERVQEVIKTGLSRKPQVVTQEGAAPRPETKAEITARIARVKKIAARLKKRTAKEAEAAAPAAEAIPQPTSEQRAAERDAAMEAGMPDYEAAMQQEAQSKADAPGVEAMRTLGEPRYSIASTAHDALDRIKRSAPGWEKAFRARLVDYLTYSKDMLEKATGKKYQDIAAMRATLARRSKIAYRSAQELQTRIDKFAADLKRTGVKLDDLDSFLHARVAPIANAIVEKRRENDPNLSAINSGMSDAAATEIISNFQKDPVLYKKLVELARQFDDNNEHSLRMALKAQLISQEDFDAMRAAYDPATYGLENPDGFKSWYASMRDVPEPTDEYTSGAIGRNIGQGIGAMGKVYKARLGRRIATDETGAEVTRDLASPVANSFMDLQNNIIRSVKADEQRLYAQLVKDINDPTFGVVLDKIPTTEVLGQDGYVHTIPDPNWMGRPEILPFKENGKWRAIEFTKRTQRIALDLKTLTVLKPYESVAAVTRWYSGLLTRNNPGFMVKNFFRDLGWAALVAQSKYGSKFLSTMAGEYRSGMRDLWNAYRGKGESELLREYRASGAESTVYNLRDYEMTLKEMERLTRGGSSLDNFKAWWEKRIGGANDLIENGMRFAAFRAARRMGKTADEAMVYAKEGVSLNFEQTGEWGRRVSSLYAFFNAGMNGADALWRIVNSKDPAVRLRARQMMAMVAALGALNETLNRLLDYDDEDGTPLYDSISEFEKNRNAVALGPDGTFAKMPLPLGPNGFYAAGRNAVAAAFGAKTPFEAAADSIAFLSDTFNPFGSGPMQQMVAPTLMDPFVQWWSNQSFTGAKLAPDEEMFGRATKPPHELYWRNTGEIPKWIASALADMTPKGDSGFAYIDVRPDIIEHFAEAAFGGVGRSAYQVVDPAVRLATGEVPEAREVFGLRDFFGSATPYAVDKRYGEIREQADVAKARFKDLMEAGERQRALDWRKANAKLFAIEARMRTTERLLDRIPNTTENEARRRTLKANLVRTYHASTDQ